MPPLETAALAGPTVARGSSRTIIPVLIQVPSVTLHSRRRPSAVRSARPRRRLKREFRIAAAALVVSLPMACVSPYLVRAIASNSAGHAASLASFDAPPIISLRLEPDSSGVLASPVSPTTLESRSPVALRGEILPDDGSMEGSAHAGS